MTLKWHDGALEEMRDAVAFYEQRVPDLGQRFRDRVAAAIARMSTDPTSYEQIRPGMHRILVSKFPYSIMYRVKSDGVQIVAIAHHKRRTGYWLARIRDDTS